jgi:hypothetical protein
MAKARKSKAKRSAKKKTTRVSTAKAKSRAKTRAKTRTTRKPKARRSGQGEGAVSMVEEAAALRARLAGRNTFED